MMASTFKSEFAPPPSSDKARHQSLILRLNPEVLEQCNQFPGGFRNPHAFDFHTYKKLSRGNRDAVKRLINEDMRKTTLEIEMAEATAKRMRSGVPSNEIGINDTYGVYAAVRQEYHETIHEDGKLSVKAMERWIKQTCSGIRVSELYEWMANSQLDGDSLRYRCMIRKMGPDFRSAWLRHYLPNQAETPELYDKDFYKRVAEDRAWFEAIHDLKTLKKQGWLPPEATFADLQEYRKSQRNVDLAKALVKRIKAKKQEGSAGIGSKRVRAPKPTPESSQSPLAQIVDKVTSGEMKAQLLAEYMASGKALDVLLKKLAKPPTPALPVRQDSAQSVELG
jgi:hypothetical protein